MHPHLAAQLADDRARDLRAAADRHRLVAPALRRRISERAAVLAALARGLFADLLSGRCAVVRTSLGTVPPVPPPATDASVEGPLRGGIPSRDR
jgi:hypothetical protein